VIHLTHQGQYAGLTFCGQPRNHEDRYVHGFQPGMRPENLENVCPACLKVYAEASEDD
jgi:hypothetical protein